MADNSENEKKPDVVEEQSGAQAAGAAEAFRNEVNDTQKDTTSATVSRSSEASLPSSGSSLPNLDITMDREGKDRVKDGAASQEKGSETKEPWQIAKDLADAVKNGKPLDDVQKDIGDYIQKMMKAGMSEHEIRTWIGHLSSDSTSRNTGLTNADGKPLDLAVRLSGDDNGGFRVHIMANEMSKDEKELSRFDVGRPGDQAAPTKEGDKHPNEIAKDIADALKNGKPLDQVQKDVGDYIQKMMAAGMSEFEIRKWVGHLGNEVNKASKPESMHIMMSGDGSDGFKVHFIQDALTKNEKELHTFHVPRK